MVTRCVEQIQRTSRPLCLALSVSLRPWAPLQGGVPVYGAKEFWVISRQKGGRLEDCHGFVRRWGEGREVSAWAGLFHRKEKGYVCFIERLNFFG